MISAVDRRMCLLYNPKGPRSCQEIAQCSKGFPNGKYSLLAPSTASKSDDQAMFYCHAMNTNKPVTFLSLVQENYSNYGGSKKNKTYPAINRNYTKVAIDMETLEVNGSVVTFASPSTPLKQHSRFGEAGSCRLYYSPKWGKMKMDLRGTPFHVHPEVTWHAEGYQPKMKNLAISKDRKIVSLLCDGSCGYCRPRFRGSKGKLVLAWD